MAKKPITPAQAEAKRAEYWRKESAKRERIAKRNQAKQARRERNAVARDIVSRIEPKSLFIIIFAILLLIALISGLAGTNETRSFGGLLEFLTSAPQFDLSFIKTAQLDWGDWGIFDFLQNFLQGIAGLILSGLYLLGAMINAISIFSWFVGWIFIGF